MADGNGGCCIARWGGGGHVEAAASGYNTSKMGMIMLKFRPIAPKPTAGTTSATEGSGSGIGSGRQAKAGGRGRKKANTKDNNNNSGSSTRRCNNNNNNGRKRKSSFPDRRCDLDLVINERGDLKTDLTLLPLFPEAPSSSAQQQQQQRNVPFSMLNFDSSVSSCSPTFEGNYNNYRHQVSWW